MQHWFGPPQKKKKIRNQERIQRTAAKVVPELLSLLCENRLEEIDLATLEERTRRGDSIALYKFTNGLDKFTTWLWQRGGGDWEDSKTLKMGTCLNDKKMYTFPCRSVCEWEWSKRGDCGGGECPSNKGEVGWIWTMRQDYPSLAQALLTTNR